MRKILFLSAFIHFLFILSCKYKSSDQNYKGKDAQLIFVFNKVIVANVGNTCMTIFKIKITNPFEFKIIMEDNPLNNFSNNITDKNKGFYLKNKNNSSIIPISMEDYYYFEVDPKSSKYYYLRVRDFEKSSIESDSLLLKEKLSNFVIEYNGKRLDLNKIKKSKYLTDTEFNDFIKNKNKYIPYNDSTKIQLPEKKLILKYIYKIPETKAEWDAL